MLSFLVAVMSYYYFYFFYVLLLDDRNLHLNTRRFSSSLSVFGRPIFSMFTTMQFCLKKQKKNKKEEAKQASASPSHVRFGERITRLEHRGMTASCCVLMMALCRRRHQKVQECAWKGRKALASAISVPSL